MMDFVSRLHVRWIVVAVDVRFVFMSRASSVAASNESRTRPHHLNRPNIISRIKHYYMQQLF